MRFMLSISLFLRLSFSARMVFHFEMAFKLLLVAILMFAATDSAPVKSSSTATIIRQEYVRTEDGYRFEYETSDGQIRSETGKLVTDADGNQYLQVEGYFSYIGPDGETYEGSYTADRNGYTFQPIEKPPAVGISNNVLLSLVG